MVAIIRVCIYSTEAGGYKVFDSHVRDMYHTAREESPGLVDFAIGLVNSVSNLPDGQVMFYEEFNNRRTMKSILLVKKFWGLVEMMSGLINASFSLPEWQAVKMIFFAPWS